MNSAIQMYALGLDQIATAILNGGDKRTILVQGHMGTGKSSLLTTLSRDLPKHTPCYFDCTTKDLGDITIPKMNQLDNADYVSYATNEELGAHHKTPIILMIDEYGKANPAVKNALLRVMLERKIGGYELHPDSLVFATTNLGAEGVGDLLPPHARNRITVITARKPDNMEWIEWGINNGIDPTILGWVKDNPHVFADFRDVKDPNENQYIHHPQAVGRTQFCTPRSFHKLSKIFSKREHLDEHTLTCAAIGTIGAAAALDLMAFVKLANQLPSAESIKADPLNATVPNSASAICMVVYRTLAGMDKEFVTPWLTYLNRLPAEAQGMFANGVMVDKYHAQKVVTTNAGWGKWCMANTHLFAADKV
jgi:hypothetical protein